MARARHESTSESSSEQDSPKRNQSIRERRVSMRARKAWGDFSHMHRELVEMSRQNAELLGLQVQWKVFRRWSDRSGLLEIIVADTGCSYSISSQSIIKDLNIPVKSLRNSLTTVDTAGQRLNLIKTAMI